ncbi:SAM-dependent methyltransferase [Streptomyces erythrochromogenes]|uniref:SAM-dependent methyltransferase n=1 Tax=Streptomyces erythrochromogenes TaxID=285574 RepID=UPI000A904F6E|nr:SAM-dependent methyltransferase [Streptomyces erythrochromogenes]
MPMITLYTPAPSPGVAALQEVSDAVTGLLNLPSGHCWMLWQQLEPGSFHRPEWEKDTDAPAPVGFVVCKQSYTRDQVGALLKLLQARLGDLLGVAREEIYLTVQRATAGELLVRGEVWQGDEIVGEETGRKIKAVTDVVPVGFVHNDRLDLTDDNWGPVTSVIHLDSNQFTSDALLRLDSFSHVEVVYHLHRVPVSKIQRGARHPRSNVDWPLVGIFAQRGKNRPNRIGVSRCRLLRVDGLDIHVEGLDAVDGTPVLDIKPYMTQFAPRGKVVQPTWVDELMRNYY